MILYSFIKILLHRNQDPGSRIQDQCVQGTWLLAPGSSAPYTRPGYVFLLSVLFVGAIVITAGTTLTVLGISSNRNGLAYAQSAQAMRNAETCIERALKSLRANSSYSGDETFTLTNGSCTLMSISGSSGPQGRNVCASGTFNNAVRRLEVDVSQFLPAGKFRTWKEVPNFTLCSP